MKKTALALLVVSNLANASGTLMQEATYANAGAAGAGDGVYTETATAAYTNPATMSHMGKSKTTINTMLLDLHMDYTDTPDESPLNNTRKAQGDGSAHTIMPSFGIFHVTQLNEDVHLGLMFGSIGGTAVEYGSDWEGAIGLDEALVTAVQFNPALSFKVTDKVSIGLGAQLNYGILEAKTTTLETDLDGDFAWSFNAGAMYQEDDWAVGLSYRSKIEHEFDVDVISNIDDLETLSTDLIFPTIVDLSGSYDLNPQLTLLGSVQWHKWSDYPATPLYVNGSDTAPVSVDRDWDDVWKFAIGTDYQLNATWALKAGFSYETSPQDDPTKQWVDLPVGEQYRYSIGASNQLDNIRIDMFYEFADLGTVHVERSNVDVTGSFDGYIHFIGANVTF
ncbi:OmpP1/FadL family transporter [Vibrio agarivorans]|uniref:Outer membrane protein transport protein n=1 Tax=Vibrio agarivorans TaxID=153622 RepID=A0ABT7XZH9_9VIBR|nr:outer membrane protein transport protein [Vibrio agarivorans]MDN2481192.1 outer membrane protein transport protein [Vibrio agarivorans]